METQIFVKQIKSTIGRDWRQGLTMKSLGPRRIGHEVSLKDTPAIRGMIRKVQHLVDVKVTKIASKAKAKAKAE
jgi:large subunit ribosomal protein L30